MLNRLYEQYMATHGIQKPSTASTFPPKDGDLTEENYQPLVTSNEPLPDPEAPRPVYPAYTGYFMSAHDAKAYRKRIRITPKEHAPDVERVKQYGRQYWVRRIYEAMIDVTAISDGDSSIHRLRFTGTPGFDPQDLEAVAHHVFDSALAVHERGWNRPKIYHKKVVRGKLADVSEKSLETRLARICLCLKQKKATVDDAIRGGVTLALLCDNPEARGFTKVSNNTGNKKRGERLRLAKGTDQNGQQQQQQHSGED
ncbi:uncharacterized protein K460DRAFT_291747 [Cucurbitaria berberidis CBS 394.84]|uniref:Uncharacterized protein n=1 Tax=Cucurbitaria berberidis CBS 394.84 TaxID=1168544 RepID=A0A9P4G9N0_9PLEO|nr:uncharacterized protein K460DRAFT_291747 [Cucurbitaria berberidis CBS 394.84]KAF1841421.1 hypothetical protein K460DRAFT_291747 [Cucurbitaria berberidis CBS 394.84]